MSAWSWDRWDDWARPPRHVPGVPVVPALEEQVEKSLRDVALGSKWLIWA